MGGFKITRHESSLLAGIVELSQQPSHEPLPGRVLELLQDLLHAEWVTFVGLDSTQPRIRFYQDVDPDGQHCLDSETREEARTNPFWHRYWDPDRGCSYADRTGDYTFVRRASDYQSLRQRRAWATSDEPFQARLIQACLPAESRGRYSRVTAFRNGSDFTEKDVFFLTLLQPHFLASYAARAATPKSTPCLTRRQMELMCLVRDGLSNRQIARRTGLSEGTVHRHLTNIYDRLDVRSRTAAVHAFFEIPDHWDTALVPQPAAAEHEPSTGAGTKVP
jgi:DNA-binding CsgD family transcriptional regulator